MPPSLNKLRKRFTVIITNSLSSLLPQFFNTLISIIVIRFTHIDLWGEFINLLILINLGAHIAAWGNRDYLLREFSFKPSHIIPTWQQCLMTRLWLLGSFSLIIALLGYPPTQTLLLIAWAWVTVLKQSHEVMVVYHKDFLWQLGLELAQALFIAFGLLWLGANINLNNLMGLFILGNLGQGILFSWYYATVNRTLNWRQGFVWGYFPAAAPFFLLNFSGLLQSRLDLYCVAYFLSKRDLGQYQILINLLLYLQALANFILVPYVKTLYRLPNDLIFKISGRLFILGFVILGPALAVVYAMLIWLYHLPIPLSHVLLGGLFVWPLYGYTTIIYGLYKINRQTLVVKISLVGALVNLILNLALLPYLGWVGSLLASTIVQWLMLGLYVWQLTQTPHPDPLLRRKGSKISP